MDFGYVRVIDRSDVLILAKENEFNSIFAYPSLCFQCTLSELQPSRFNSQKGKWVPEAIELFNKFTKAKEINICIYSVVNDVASVRLSVNNVEINAEMINKGFGQFCDESYMSKMDYDMRSQRQSMGRTDYGPEVEFMGKSDNFKTMHIIPPRIEMCRKKVCLKGPFSPLETSLHGFTYGANSEQVMVDSNSVNSVVLDTDPQVIFFHI